MGTRYRALKPEGTPFLVYSSFVADREDPRPDPSHAALSDRMVTPERSVFGTRLPRPTGVGRHLIIVILLSLAALAIAIVFAERDTAEEGDTKPKTFKPAGG
jgi:hypothetical protein